MPNGSRSHMYIRGICETATVTRTAYVADDCLTTAGDADTATTSNHHSLQSKVVYSASVQQQLVRCYSRSSSFASTCTNRPLVPLTQCNSQHSSSYCRAVGGSRPLAAAVLQHTAADSSTTSSTT
eukprot:5865-Heterococcus_DN1.PRE.3